MVRYRVIPFNNGKDRRYGSGYGSGSSLRVNSNLSFKSIKDAKEFIKLKNLGKNKEAVKLWEKKTGRKL